MRPLILKKIWIVLEIVKKHDYNMFFCVMICKVLALFVRSLFHVYLDHVFNSQSIFSPMKGATDGDFVKSAIQSFFSEDSFFYVD